MNTSEPGSHIWNPEVAEQIAVQPKTSDWWLPTVWKYCSPSSGWTGKPMDTCRVYRREKRWLFRDQNTPGELIAAVEGLVPLDFKKTKFISLKKTLTQMNSSPQVNDKYERAPSALHSAQRLPLTTEVELFARKFYAIKMFSSKYVVVKNYYCFRLLLLSSFFYCIWVHPGI